MAHQTGQASQHVDDTAASKSTMPMANSLSVEAAESQPLLDHTLQWRHCFQHISHTAQIHSVLQSTLVTQRHCASIVYVRSIRVRTSRWLEAGAHYSDTG